MSNQTVQQIFNTGWDLLAITQQAITGASGIGIGAQIGTNRIVVTPVSIDAAGANLIYIGGVSVDASNGFPLFSVSTEPAGAALVYKTKTLIIDTTTPQNFYLFCTAGTINVAIIYYKLT